MCGYGFELIDRDLQSERRLRVPLARSPVSRQQWRDDPEAVRQAQRDVLRQAQQLLERDPQRRLVIYETSCRGPLTSYDPQEPCPRCGAVGQLGHDLRGDLTLPDGERDLRCEACSFATLKAYEARQAEQEKMTSASRQLRERELWESFSVEQRAAVEQYLTLLFAPED